MSYDIACKYHINFRKRIETPDCPLFDAIELGYMDNNMVIVWVVPKFHLAAHVEPCGDNFDLNKTDGTGKSCGEILESNWSSFNFLAGSVREMGWGHRRDVLIDCMLDWNYRKNANAGEAFSFHFFS